MKPLTLAIRAIGAEFARRLWLAVFIAAAIAAVVLVAILLILVNLSSWWWLLAIPIGVGISVAAALLTIFLLTIRYVQPVRTREQVVAIKAFVDKLQFVADLQGTPKVFILFRVMRSISAPSSEPYLQELFATKTLASDFKKIMVSFKTPTV